MNIAETIYQHVKVMPMDKALAVLQFVAFIETKHEVHHAKQSENDALEFIKNLPIAGKRKDLEINRDFQALRDEWK